MSGEVLVLDVDARDLGRAGERRALGVDGQLGSDLVELPLEPPREVGHLEVDARVNGIEVPGTGRGNGENRGGHRLLLLSSFGSVWIYLQLQAPYPTDCCVCK